MILITKNRRLSWIILSSDHVPINHRAGIGRSMAPPWVHRWYEIMGRLLWYMQLWRILLWKPTRLHKKYCFEEREKDGEEIKKLVSVIFGMEKRNSPQMQLSMLEAKLLPLTAFTWHHLGAKIKSSLLLVLYPPVCCCWLLNPIGWTERRWKKLDG